MTHRFSRVLLLASLAVTTAIIPQVVDESPQAMAASTTVCDTARILGSNASDGRLFEWRLPELNTVEGMSSVSRGGDWRRDSDLALDSQTGYLVALSQPSADGARSLAIYQQSVSGSFIGLHRRQLVEPFTQIFALSDRVFMGVRRDSGTLDRFEIARDGRSFTGFRTVHASSGWKNYKAVFAGGPSTIYGVDTNGQLRWFDFNGIEVRGGNIVHESTGWKNYTNFMGAGQGVILAVDSDGRLTRWDHPGHDTGAANVHYTTKFGSGFDKYTSMNLSATTCHEYVPEPAPETVEDEYAPINDYPYNGACAGADPWLFLKGQCTSFAAWRVVDTLGVGSFNNYYRGVHFGDAYNWANAAQQAGLAVGNSPHPGDIAVNTAGDGHVAFVTKVYSNGSYDIEEYNYNVGDGWCRYHTDHIEPNGRFSRFITFP